MEPLAAPAPSPQWRHIGLCPSLVEKDETPGCKPCLKTLPYGPPAGDIRTLLLAGRDAFFEAKTFPPQKAPKGIAGHGHAACAEFS